jgi:hypothetical protein
MCVGRAKAIAIVIPRIKRWSAPVGIAIAIFTIVTK